MMAIQGGEERGGGIEEIGDGGQGGGGCFGIDFDGVEVLLEGFWERGSEEHIAVGEQGGDGIAEGFQRRGFDFCELLKDVFRFGGGMLIAVFVEIEKSFRPVCGNEICGFGKSQQCGEVATVGLGKPILPCVKPTLQGRKRGAGGGMKGGPSVMGEKVCESGAGVFIGTAQSDLRGSGAGRCNSLEGGLCLTCGIGEDGGGDGFR